MASRNIYQALQVADFRWLWIGSVTSSLAMNMQVIARGWLMYTLTSSAMDLAWVTLSFMLPGVVFALWGGVVADRLPKRSIVTISQTLNCIATVIMGAIVITDHVTFWDFVWFGFFNGTVLALSMPARQAFVPELIPDRLMFTGMALTMAAWNLTRILGPALAGFLIALLAAGNTSSTYGVGMVYFLIASLYLASSATMLLVRKRGMVTHADERKSSLTDMADAFRYVRANPPIFGLILLSIVPFLFGMPINTLLPAYNEDILGGGPDTLGLLMSAMGVGAIAGSILLASVSEFRHRAAWLIASCVGWGAATMAFGMANTLPLAGITIAMIGFVSSWNMSLNRGLLQLQVDDHMRGRILSVDMMSHGLMPLGVIPISMIAEQYDVAIAMMASGAIFIVVVLLMMALCTSVRRVDEDLQPLSGS